MEKIMLFQKNAEVVDANGELVGSLERVVLNPESKLVTDIVIRTGTLFNKANKVVPVGFIVKTAEDEIVLSHAADEIASLPPLVRQSLGDADRQSANATPVIHGISGLHDPLIVSAPMEQFFTQTDQNIPDGTVAIKEGARVITADGKHVGNVERVLADAAVDKVTNLEISKGRFVKEWRLIPIKWVTTMGENEIHLRVNERSIDDE